MQRGAVRLSLRMFGGNWMNHVPFIRIVPGADTAVIFIHGIVGTPRHFDDLLPLVSMVPEEFSVCNVLLDGHGGRAEDFSATSMDAWESQIRSVFSVLRKNHRNIVFVGHSLGTLLSLQMAQENPEQIPFLYCLAVPIRVRILPSMILRMLRLAFGCMKEDDPKDRSLAAACGVEVTWKLWKYLGWIPRMLELLKKTRQTEKLLGSVNVPVYAFQSDRDELVCPKTGKILLKNPMIHVTALPSSGHFYYSAGDREVLIKSFQHCIHTIKSTIE